MNREKPATGQGVRHLSLKDQAPNCEIVINAPLYNLRDYVKGKTVLDIGCGYGRNRKIVEEAGGKWYGLEPFEGGANNVVGDAQDLPFEDNSIDIAIMDAVLEHVPDASKAVSEVGRVLKPGGYFLGYVAFMECFHEISYSHISYKALEYFAESNGMRLEKISGGGAFGIDYHLKVLMYPLPFGLMRKMISKSIRGINRTKAGLAYWGLRFKRKMPSNEARDMARLYYQVECLRQSNGFSHVIRKL